MPTLSDWDRSTAFTIFLDVDPGFAQMDSRAGRERITEFIKSWNTSSSADMHAFALEWIRRHPIEETR